LDVELLLRLAADTDHRLTGMVRRCEDGALVAFSGRLELLACLERLCLEAACLDHPGADPTTGQPRPTT
jgi:hypothetical protein